jgi:hypothetical protein
MGFASALPILRTWFRGSSKVNEEDEFEDH